MPSAGSPPTITLLLANYNDGVFLRTSLQAILCQTRLPDEIIIVDDGSTDDSIEVIQRFMASCPRIRLLRHERNLGQHTAIQRALAEAGSEYVVWASSDDLLLPQFVEATAQVLSSHPGIGLCFSALCTWREGTQRVQEFTWHGPAFDLGSAVRSYSPRQLRDELKHRYVWISGNTVVARRDALLAAGGFNERLRWHADWFAFYAVALRHGACSIPRVLAIMRERDQTYSRDGMLDREAQRTVLRAIVDVIKQPENRDLRDTFQTRPRLLSPFGGEILAANALRPSTWHLMVPFLAWLVPQRIRDMLWWVNGTLAPALPVFWWTYNLWREWGPRSARTRRAARMSLFAAVRRISNKRARAQIAAMLYWYRARRAPRGKARAISAEDIARDAARPSRYS